MSKYDCNNVMDYGHELLRLCNSHPLCSGDNGECPLKNLDCNSLGYITQRGIDVLQKWSDEHPEPPKLTKKERAFLECFATGRDKTIVKDSDGNSFYRYDGEYSKLSDGMFKALEPGTRMTFEELMKLEVEE